MFDMDEGDNDMTQGFRGSVTAPEHEPSSLPTGTGCDMCGEDFPEGELFDVPGMGTLCDSCAELYGSEGEREAERREEDAIASFGDDGRYHEGICFDKFMDSTLLAESAKKKVDAKDISPMRQRAARHQERPLGRTRFNGGK